MRASATPNRDLRPDGRPPRTGRLRHARFTGRYTANRASPSCRSWPTTGAPGGSRHGWHPDLVASSLIEPRSCRRPSPSAATWDLCSRVAATSGCRLDPVLSGINDTQAGAVAAGAWRGDHAGLALGTTSVIATHSTEEAQPAQARSSRCRARSAQVPAVRRERCGRRRRRLLPRQRRLPRRPLLDGGVRRRPLPGVQRRGGRRGAVHRACSSCPGCGFARSAGRRQGARRVPQRRPRHHP